MDKIDRLLDAMENPGNYTQEEIDAMLRDPEVKDVFDLLDKTSASIKPIIDPDVDAEWERFESRPRKSVPKITSGLFSRISRNAAAVIAIAIASFVAVAAVVVVRNVTAPTPGPTKNVELPVEMATTTLSDTVSPEVVESLPSRETIIFDNEPFETIITGIAKYYGYTPEFKTESSKSLRLYFRWNQEMPIEEVVESLNNFEQIHLLLSGQTIIID